MKIISTLAMGILSSSAFAEPTSVIHGHLNFSEECQSDSAEVFLSQGKDNLLYQISVPPKGTFNLHVNPGKYEIAIRGDRDCFSKKEIEVSGPTKAELELSSTSRKPAFYETSGQVMCFRAPCLQQQQTFQLPPYLQTYPYPPWAYYGMTRYPNFYYPGPWGIPGGGIVGPYYPGRGNIGLDKPVVYIDADPKTEYKVKIKANSEPSDWLVSVPAYEDGWKVKSLKSGAVSVAGVEYSFLHYDLRVDDKNLQTKNGFCVDRLSAVPKMAAILKSLQFKENEISDFTSYWNLKIPNLPEVCVYPQTETELSLVAQYEITPKIEHRTRVLFVVLAHESFKGHGLFTSAPTAEWKAPVLRKPTRAEPKLREWGVAFHMDGVAEAKK